MTAPIYDFLNKIKNENPYPFHMPGHKRQAPFPMPSFEMDITEINGADNLHKPEGIIRQALDSLSRLVGSDESFFCVNGSSGALLSAIMCLLKDGEKILVARNCHRSVHNGILLRGAIPVYVYPKILENGLCGGILKEDIQRAIEKYPDIKGVILTSPTYEGFTSDIKGIADYLHSKSIPLVIDEAHGAHFGFNPYFPSSALSQNADLVIQSWHKTLPTFTQSSVVHLKSDLIDRACFFSYLSMLQTSSPSYLFMGAMDKCRSLLEENGEKLFSEYAQRLKALREKLLHLDKIRLIDKEVIGKAGIVDFDKGKLVFEINSDINGNMLENMLIKDYNFQIEMSGLNHIILMTSLMDTDAGFDRLEKALREINSRLQFKAKGSEIAYKSKNSLSIAQIPPKMAFELPKAKIKLQNAENKISADFITPYPPGVPILAPGEIIQKSHIEEIENMIFNGIKVLGIDEKMNLEFINQNSL